MVFEEPKIEIIMLTDENVIVTSGGDEFYLFNEDCFDVCSVFTAKQ